MNMKREIKQFYWLRLKKDFFEQIEIKRLRKNENGDKLVVIYQKLLLQSISYGGYIYIENEVENVTSNDFIEDISILLNENIEDIQSLFEYCKKYKLITLYDNHCYIENTKDLIGNETESAVRMRRMRDIRKTQPSHCDENVTTEIEIELEIDKDIEKDKNKKSEKAKNFLDTQTFFEDAKLNNSFEEWLEYKKEKKDKYTEIGLKKLVTQITNKLKDYPPNKICELIDLCMSRNYKGIIFDILEKENKNKKASKKFEQREYNNLNEFYDNI
ncbi:MAG: phage replisome organizer N-terminal domain-containing protein [Clostridia bacterium]